MTLCICEFNGSLLDVNSYPKPKLHIVKLIPDWWNLSLIFSILKKSDLSETEDVEFQV